MILDAAIEAKLETRILEEWYCRDENAVPPAYYLRPKSEMLKSYQNTVSHIHLLKHSCQLKNSLSRVLKCLMPSLGRSHTINFLTVF